MLLCTLGLLLLLHTFSLSLFSLARSGLSIGLLHRVCIFNEDGPVAARVLVSHPGLPRWDAEKYSRLSVNNSFYLIYKVLMYLMEYSEFFRHGGVGLVSINAAIYQNAPWH